MNEYDYTILKYQNVIKGSAYEDKPYFEYRNGNYNRKYTLSEIVSLYRACKKILKQEGYFGEEE